MSTERPIVLDASVAITLLLDEPEAPMIASALTRWEAVGRRIVVPGHFWLELLNRLGRVRGVTGARILAAIHHVDSIGPDTVELTRPMLLQIVDRMERHRLTAYDAGYLVLAESVDAELATLDATLAVAAGQRTITFGNEHRLHEPPAAYQREVTWPSYKGVSAYLSKLRADALAAR